MLPGLSWYMTWSMYHFYMGLEALLKGVTETDEEKLKLTELPAVIVTSLTLEQNSRSQIEHVGGLCISF